MAAPIATRWCYS